VSAFLSYLIIRSSPKRYEKRYELWDLSDLRSNSTALLVLISSSLLTGGTFLTAWVVFATSFQQLFSGKLVCQSSILSEKYCRTPLTSFISPAVLIGYLLTNMVITQLPQVLVHLSPPRRTPFESRIIVESIHHSGVAVQFGVYDRVPLNFDPVGEVFKRQEQQSEK
jgi:hypothetical protein